MVHKSSRKCEVRKVLKKLYGGTILKQVNLSWHLVQATDRQKVEMGSKMQAGMPAASASMA